MAFIEILDQDGVDEVFGFGNDGSSGDTEPRPYDFLRPARLGRGARRALDGVHETFVETLKKSLTLLLKTEVELTPGPSENVSFTELAASLGDPAATWSFSVGGAIGLLDLETPAGLAVIDRLLGGTGRPVDAGRRLTVIEEGVLRRVADRVRAALEAAWNDRLSVGSELSAFTSRPSQSRAAGPEDRFLVTLFRLEAGGIEGTLTVALPHAVVEEALDTGAEEATAPAGETGPAADPDALFASDLRSARVAVAVRLPAFGLKVRALSNLEVGQVLDTVHLQEVPVDVLVNGRSLYRGAVGSVRGRVGIRVVDPVDSTALPGPHALKQGRVL
jgi:flagellar motor switch protein FliM